MILTKPKTLSNGVVANWSEIVRTEMDYKNQTSKATIYYYLNEQAFLDGKEPVMGEIIDVPYVEQEELKKVDITSKTLAETAMGAKIEVDSKPITDVLEEEII